MELEDLSNIRLAVEANRFEQLCLWEEWKDRVKWKDDNLGMWCTIGMVANDPNMPVCISFSRAQIDGEWVLFYESTSRVVDHHMVESWLKERMLDKVNFNNAMNFGNTIREIKFKLEAA